MLSGHAWQLRQRGIRSTGRWRCAGSSNVNNNNNNTIIIISSIIIMMMIIIIIIHGHSLLLLCYFCPASVTPLVREAPSPGIPTRSHLTPRAKNLNRLTQDSRSSNLPAKPTPPGKLDEDSWLCLGARASGPTERKRAQAHRRASAGARALTCAVASGARGGRRVPGAGRSFPRTSLRAFRTPLRRLPHPSTPPCAPSPLRLRAPLRPCTLEKPTGTPLLGE